MVLIYVCFFEQLKYFPLSCHSRMPLAGIHFGSPTKDFGDDTALVRFTGKHRMNLRVEK